MHSLFYPVITWWESCGGELGQGTVETDWEDEVEGDDVLGELEFDVVICGGGEVGKCRGIEGGVEKVDV